MPERPRTPQQSTQNDLDARIDRTEKKPRKYTGPAKGSQEAKDRMAKVRAAQWAKNGLVVSNEEKDE